MLQSKLLAAAAPFCIAMLLTLLSPSMSHCGGAQAAPAPAKPSPGKQAPDKGPADKDKDKEAKGAKPVLIPEPVLENVINVTVEDLVNKPHEYLNKNVKFNANFFIFSSLALDYKPALRPAKTHLSFLVLKPGTHIPLSELKLAMMIPKEKDPDNALLASLKDGDQLELVGKVFSTALDDPWVEVFKVKKLGGSADEKKASKDGESEGAKAEKKDGSQADKSTDKK